MELPYGLQATLRFLHGVVFPYGQVHLSFLKFSVTEHAQSL